MAPSTLLEVNTPGDSFGISSSPVKEDYCCPFLRYFLDDKLPLGSEVLRILPNSDKMEQVYFDDGAEFTMASIFVTWGENILLGSPNHKFMACKKQ